MKTTGTLCPHHRSQLASAALAAVFGLSGGLQAAPITWSAAQNTTAVADIDTTGDFHEARHASGPPKEPSPVPVTANGVTFGIGPIFPNGNNSNTCDAAAPDELEALLDLYGWGGSSFEISGLIIGGEYRVQVFLCDMRAVGFTTDFGDLGGGTPVTLNSNPGGAGVYGQFAIGTFTADGNTQTITVGGTSRINAYQVRTVSLPADTDPPIPSPMSFDVAPNGIGESSITMTATTATDPSGVEYYFRNITIADHSHDSGWQGSPEYTDTGLSPGTTYEYAVTARDLSADKNTGTESDPASASTLPADLNPPPTPAFASAPTALSSTEISMTATEVTDPEGNGVEYYFTCTSGGGHDSGWQEGLTYTDTGLTPDTTYAYTVMARDKSLNENPSAPSSPAEEATTLEALPGDIIWGPATTVTDNPTDVSTTGTTVAAYTGDASVTINGVTFSGQIPGLARTDTSAARFAQGTTGDYRDLLATASAPKQPDPSTGGTGNGTINLTGLSIGQQYQVQIWVGDGVTGSVDNGVTFTAGNSVFLRWEPVAGGPGQYVIGTFTASATTQDIAVAATGGWAYVNALQVRSLSATDDYGSWTTNYPGADLADPEGDYDGDGLTNDYERIWGLDPTKASSVNPISVPLNPADGSFSYTRRDDDLSGLNYSVWYSTDLESWQEDTGAVQTPGTPDDKDIETVGVALTGTLLNETRLFIQMRATE